MRLMPKWPSQQNFAVMIKAIYASGEKLLQEATGIHSGRVYTVANNNLNFKKVKK